jgi:hypothetical protein
MLQGTITSASGKNRLCVPIQAAEYAADAGDAAGEDAELTCRHRFSAIAFNSGARRAISLRMYSSNFSGPIPRLSP